MSNRRPGYRQVSQVGRNPDLPHQSGCFRPQLCRKSGLPYATVYAYDSDTGELGAAVANILFFVFCFDILLYAASQFNGRGQMWANLVCTYSFGACTHPQALLVALIPLFIASFLAHKNRQM